MIPPPPTSTLFPYTTLFRSKACPASWVSTSTSPAVPLKLEKINGQRSEEHTSELQSRFDLVCRLLLEKKNKRAVRRTTNRCSRQAPYERALIVRPQRMYSAS